MNNALLKRFLSVVMAVAMVMSMVVIPVAADEADGGNTPVACTEVEGCTAESHNTSCPAHPDNVASTVETVCNGADGCTLAADVQGHIEGCEAVKPAEKTAVDETPMECTCAVRCNEQKTESCAVCAADPDKCTGKTVEEIEAEREAAAKAAAEAAAKQVADVQDMINALPNEVKRTEMAQYKEQVDAITAILNTMTEEQTAQLTCLDKLYPTNIIENAVAWIGEQGYASVQAAVDEAIKTAGTYTITLMSGTITEDVTVKQTSGVHLTISGASDGTVLAGVLTIDGGSQAISNQSVTIQGITFEASGITGDRCISIPDGNSRYTCNVTISGCTFKDTGATDYGTVAIKQATGGCHNWTIQNCTVDGTMHSLLQAKNFEDSLIISGCTVNSKNGVSLESSANVTINGNTFNVKGYAIRTGASSGGNEAAEKIVLTNNTIHTSSSEGGDAAIVLRGSADNASITMTGNAVTTNGACHIGGTTATNTVNADANYWGGAEKPAVSGTEVTVTSYYADANRSELKPTSDVVAQVGSTYYTSIENAITDLEANGGTLTLLADAEFTKTLMIASGKNVVIDLNGHTITGKDSNASGNYELIQNKGTLTITDSTEAKNGKITLSAANNRAWNSYSAVIANMGGTLNVNAGIIEHTGGTDMAYGIDNNSTLGTTTTNISGGTVTSTYRAIRQFANSTTGVNNLNISGGTISGGNKGVWLQSSNQNANKADLTITGGSVNSVYVWAPADTESKTTDASQLNIKIAANTVSGEVKNGLPERYEISSVDGNYVIMSESKNVVQIVETGALYDTVADAVNAAAAGQTIKLLNNIEPAESITIASSKEITIDLNGKTISQSKAQTGAYSMIENNGNLTITDSTSGGKISYTDSGNGGEYVSNTIQNNGTLTVKGGTIENLSSATVAQNGYPHAIDTKGTLTVAGGNVTCSNYSAIRIWCDTTATDATISSGTINGTVDLHNVNGSANVGTLNITGGVLNPGTSGKSLRLVNFGESLENINAHVSGGTINGSFAIAGSVQGNDSGATYLKNVFRTTGGSYKVDPSPYCDPGNKGEIKDGVYSIVPDSATAVAEINGVGYTSLQAAVDSIPENGSAAIKLLTSVSTTTALTIPAGKTVILELGEYTLSAADGFSGGDSLVVVNSGASLTVASGTIDGSKTMCGIKVTEKGGDDSKTATLNVTGGTVKGGTYGIAGNGTRDNSSITISGGNINGSTAGIFHPQNGTLTISGGSISGATGVYAKSGTITVSGGSISGTGAKASYDASNNGMNSTGDALVIEKSADAAYQAPEVSVTGGTFISTHAAPIASYGEPAQTGFVTGGTFKGTEYPTNVLAPTLEYKQNADGSYTTEEKDYVIVNGTKVYYGTTDNSGNTLSDLDAVLEAYKNDGGADNLLDIQLTRDETINGDHTITAAGGISISTSNAISGTGKITAENKYLGILNDVADIESAKGGVAAFANGNVTITPTFDATKGYGTVTVKTVENGKVVDTTYFVEKGSVILGANGKVTASEGAKYLSEIFDTDGKPKYQANAYQNNTYDWVHHKYNDPDMLIECNGFKNACTKIWITGGIYDAQGKSLVVYENGSEKASFRVTDGSTKVTLPKNYLNTLSDGTYTMHFQYKDGGEAACNFKVVTVYNYVADTSNPKTGDSIFLALSVMLFTGCALAVIPFTLKKKIH